MKLKTETVLNTRKKRAARIEKRIAEIDRLYIRIYEDNAAGRLPDVRFTMMSKSYEDEQAALKSELQTVQSEISEQESKQGNLDELIKAIYVEAPDRSTGVRHQAIHISYDLVNEIPIEELQQHG